MGVVHGRPRAGNQKDDMPGWEIELLTEKRGWKWEVRGHRERSEPKRNIRQEAGAV